MFRPLEVFVGLRYLLPRRSNLYASFTSLVSMFGIMLGVAFLILVLSIMNGFGNELRARLLSLTAHVTITGPAGHIGDADRVAEIARSHPDVTEAVAYVDGQGLLINGLNLSGVRLRGLDPQAGISTFVEAVEPGVLETLEAGAGRMIMGAELARGLLVMRGDAATVMIPRASADGRIRPLLRRFDVAGVFEVGLAEHDTSTALLHIDDAAALFGLDPGAVNGVRVTVDDIFSARRVSRELAATLGPDYVLSDWTEEQSSIYRATRIEKAMMFVILLLIVAIAAFNIIATLVMVVAEKRTDIAILRTIGMRPGAVMRVFVVQGSMIGMIGTCIGALAGVALALNLESLLSGFSLLPRDVYYITAVPSDLRWGEVALVVAVAFSLSLLSTLYPARRAAATRPAEALRYE